MTEGSPQGQIDSVAGAGAPAPVTVPLAPVFQQDSYTIRRKVFKVFGAAFHLYDPAGALVGFSKQKAFKLKEDIRIYTDESCTTELLVILARSVVDFSASYDVVDPQMGQGVGTLRRRGFKSMLRDEWLLLDPAGGEIGRIKEDSAALALVRRFMSNLIPQRFGAVVNGVPVAHYKQNFNPFVRKLRVSILPEADQVVDRRLLLAAGILLGAIEGRQQ